MAHGILAKLVFGSISNFKIFVSVSLVGENLRGLREYLTHKIRILIDCDTSSAASTAASTAEVTSPPIMQNRKQHLNKLKLALPLKQRLQIVADSSQVCYLLFIKAVWHNSVFVYVVLFKFSRAFYWEEYLTNCES